MITNKGRYGYTTIEIYMDEIPTFPPNNNPGNPWIVFVKYGNYATFLPMNGIPVGSGVHKLIAPGVYVEISYPVHHDIPVISFTKNHWDNPPFYRRQFGTNPITQGGIQNAQTQMMSPRTFTLANNLTSVNNLAIRSNISGMTCNATYAI